MMTREELLADRTIVPIKVELRSPFGEVIAEFTIREQYCEHGGLGSIGSLMRACGVKDFNAPFTIPGMDTRAQFYFHVIRGREGLRRFHPLDD
jgi:hypothetical protein